MNEPTKRFVELEQIVASAPREEVIVKDRGLTLVERARAWQIDREQGPVAAEKYRVECRRRAHGDS